jgi:hypothetical protein
MVEHQTAQNTTDNREKTQKSSAQTMKGIVCALLSPAPMQNRV